MAKVVIIGRGQSGLQLGSGLVQAGVASSKRILDTGGGRSGVSAPAPLAPDGAVRPSRRVSP